MEEEVIPLFPLHSVAMPHEPLPLHIFEERFKQLIAFCLRPRSDGTARPFGVLYADKNQPRQVGCSVVITRILNRYDDGRMDILTIGRRRYRILKTLEEDPFPTAQVRYFDDEEEPLERHLYEKALALHYKWHEVVKGSTHLEDLSDYPKLSFALASRAGLEPAQKQQLLELLSENERLIAIIEYYRRVLPIALEEEETKRRTHSNGHFKKAPLA